MFKERIKKIAAELSRREIPYMIVGGQAVLLYGEPRLTKGIDITLGVGVEKLTIVVRAVRALGLRMETEDIGAFVRETMVLPAADLASGIRVDFIFSFTSYERQAIDRARVEMFDEIPVRFAALEDLVIHKVVAGRARDMEDVKIILLKNPDYDGEYIRSWLADFDRALEGSYLRRFEEIAS